MGSDLIERLHESAQYSDQLESTMLLEAADEIASLRTALAAEREAREKAEKEAERLRAENERNRQGFEFHAGLAEKKHARAIAAESSLAEAKRLLKPFADFGKTDFSGTAWANQTSEAAVLYHYGTDLKITLGDFRAAARFLAQESNDER